MGFPRQEYWNGLPYLSPGNLLDLWIEPPSPALQADSLPLSHWETSDSLLLLLLLSRFSHVRLCVTHRRQPTRLPVPGILQARTLDWVAISFSNV